MIATIACICAREIPGSQGGCFLFVLDKYYICASPVGSALDALVLDHLNPISIGVQNESDILHHAIGETLLEVHIEGLEPVACRLEIVDGDT